MVSTVLHVLYILPDVPDAREMAKNWIFVIEAAKSEDVPKRGIVTFVRRNAQTIVAVLFSM
ncbi:MAG: hypothetical protein PUB73_07465 [Bacteroidales bacterium]|nr:hypothetical protein [Bacteroidales bacterium]